MLWPLAHLGRFAVLDPLAAAVQQAFSARRDEELNIDGLFWHNSSTP